MTKAQYLEAPAAWKASYKSITVDIRQAKVEYREAQKAFAKHGPYNYNQSSADEKNKAYLVAQRDMLRAMNHRDALRYKATELIEQRIAMKEEAGRAMELIRQSRETC